MTCVFLSNNRAGIMTKNKYSTQKVKEQSIYWYIYSTCIEQEASCVFPPLKDSSWTGVVCSL
jgi:hypothetical protein